MSRLTWAAAWPLIDSLFVARPATWPRRLTPLHLAWLQLPDAPGRMKRAAADAIEQACADGELPSEIAPFELGNPEYRFRISGPAPWVLAADFLAWLRAERAEPSVHVRAWGEATGANGAAPPLPARVPLMSVNRARVLAALRAAGFDPLALPPVPRGRACRAKLAARRGARLTDASFDRAWHELSKGCELRRA